MSDFILFSLNGVLLWVLTSVWKCYQSLISRVLFYVWLLLSRNWESLSNAGCQRAIFFSPWFFQNGCSKLKTTWSDKPELFRSNTHVHVNKNYQESMLSYNIAYMLYIGFFRDYMLYWTDNWKTSQDSRHRISVSCHLFER